jgi:hypothetical protein
VSEAVTPGRPERSDRLADCPVVWVRLFVHEAGVSQLALGGGCWAVDAVRWILECARDLRSGRPRRSASV